MREGQQYDDGAGRRREHANIEAMQNLMLEAVASETGTPMPPLVRNFISALQSAHGGGKVANEPFTRSHLRVAAYMQFKGEREAKEQRVRRLINRLEGHQNKTGYLFFLIKRGGEPVGTDPQGNTIYSATSYTDFLKPIADAAVQRARASELWKRNPGDALAAQVTWALGELPRVDETQDEEKQPNKLPLSDYERQSEEQLLASVEKRADGIAERGGDVGLWLEKLEIKIGRLRRSQIKTVSRDVPMSAAVRGMLEVMPKTSGHVFPSPKTGGQLVDIKRPFGLACEAAKIKDFRFHDLRHTAATRMADAAINVVVIAEILGHADIRTTKRYAHAMEEAKREAVEKLAKSGAARQTPVKKQKRQAGRPTARSEKLQER